MNHNARVVSGTEVQTRSPELRKGVKGMQNGKTESSRVESLT